MDKFIELINVKKSYGKYKQKTLVLEDIDLALNKGEFTVLLGPSGSGKSTLLNLIGLLDTPDTGKILFEDKNILQLDEEEKSVLRSQKIGFVFQFDSLLAEFSVVENINMPSIITGNFDKEPAIEILKHLNMSHLAYKMPQELSGGEKQRVAIARALRNKPQIILADEPTGNLDENNAKIIYEDLKQLTETGVSVLMATHNPKSSQYANRVLKLEHRKINHH